jgi:hypothetical protein
VHTTGDRKYTGAVGEIITIEIESTSTQVPSVTGAVNTGAAQVLPIDVTVTAGTHFDIVVDAAFSGTKDGRTDIRTTGSLGGTDRTKIRQLEGVPSNAKVYTVDPA